ncbi:MAG TPA: efflux RND transporter periplasmic adaptor subunit [Terracidiphilus sp.]|jgi:multidrug efflux system membrane fusion protein|nr:efflux RND transporter periplasmic adaptor subunit [Terracidiphilus sp.]
MDLSSSVSHSGHNHPESHKKRRHWWIWAIILLLFGLLFYWVIREHNQSQQAVTRGGGRGRFGMAGPIPVTYVKATKGDVGVYLDAIGTVTPVYQDSITAQVTGVITAVHYREGQFVKKGDPLIDIDDRTYKAQLAQAEGTLERDQNLLAEAQMDLKRYQDAWAKNAIPRQTLEDQEKQVLQDQGTVKNDQGVVQYDQVLVGFCHIASPISGRVGLRLVDPGNLVTANSTTTLVVIAQTAPITVIFTIAEDSLPQVVKQMHSGKALQVQAFDRNQQTLLDTGRLITIDNLIDTTTGTVKLRAQFDNSKGMLFPNQFVNTRLLVNTLENQTIIPSSAIQHNGSTDFVYVIKNPDEKTASAAMTKIKSGVSDEGKTAVTGITPGTVVADSSFQKLVDKAPVYQSKVALPSSGETEDDTP